MEEGTIIDEYRTALRRAAWRARYRQRVRSANEVPCSDWGDESIRAASEPLREECLLREYLELIPFDNGKRVIEALFVEGETEAAVAAELGMSQQGVSKWKRKSLDRLRRELETPNS